MQRGITTVFGSSLQGAWDTARALEGAKFLAGELLLLLEADPRPVRVTLDLAGLTAIDACGCQLLAVFLGNLKRHGITPHPSRIPRGIAEQIRQLGFDEALIGSSAKEKDIP